MQLMKHINSLRTKAKAAYRAWQENDIGSDDILERNVDTRTEDELIQAFKDRANSLVYEHVTYYGDGADMIPLDGNLFDFTDVKDLDLLQHIYPHKLTAFWFKIDREDDDSVYKLDVSRLIYSFREYNNKTEISWYFTLNDLDPAPSDISDKWKSTSIKIDGQAWLVTVYGSVLLLMLVTMIWRELGLYNM